MVRGVLRPRRRIPLICEIWHFAEAKMPISLLLPRRGEDMPPALCRRMKCAATVSIAPRSGANPMTAIVETFRYGFFGAGTFSWTYLGYSAGFMFALLLLGMAVFNRVERTFMDTV